MENNKEKASLSQKGDSGLQQTVKEGWRSCLVIISLKKLKTDNFQKKKKQAEFREIALYDDLNCSTSKLWHHQTAKYVKQQELIFAGLDEKWFDQFEWWFVSYNSGLFI